MCRELKSKRLLAYDPFELLAELSCYHLRYCVEIRRYKLSIFAGGVVYRRRHRCPFKLVVAGARVLERNMATHQKKMTRIRGEPSLGAFVARKVPISSTLIVPNTYPTFPSVLNGGKKPIQTMEDWLDGPACDYGYVRETYINSRDVLDSSLRTEALTQLVEPREDFSDEETVDLITNMLLNCWATMPHDHEDIPRMTVEALVKQPTTKSIAGAINVQSSDGIITGNKEEMITSAAVAAFNSIDVLNCVGSPKAEVLKRGKKVRQIIAEPMPLYLKTSYFFGRIIRRHGRIVDGDATGLSKVDGNFIKWVFSAYYDELEFDPSLGWEEFLDLLEDIGLCEDDKTAWEKTTNRACGVAATMFMTSLISIDKHDTDHLSQVLAHLLAPVVKFYEHLCYVAPYKVASGTLPTLYLNNIRHIMGSRQVGTFVQLHGMRWGDPSCNCRGCLAVGDNRGEPATWRDLSRVVGGVHLGDDRIRLGHKNELVCRLVDCFLGTETKCRSCKAFDDAEFLRTRLKRTNENISCYRDAERIVAKLYHGDAQHDTPRLLAAIQCAAMELGDNEEGNKLLQDLYKLVNPSATELVQAEAHQWRHVHEGVLRGDPVRPATIEEVRLRTCLMDKPAIETYIAHRHATLN